MVGGIILAKKQLSTNLLQLKIQGTGGDRFSSGYINLILPKKAFSLIDIGTEVWWQGKNAYVQIDEMRDVIFPREGPMYEIKSK